MKAEITFEIMPKIIIDGKEYEYEGNPKLLQFMLDNGIDVPYFCYHPAMSSPTNCRMCLVEIGYPVKNRQTGEIEYNEDGTPKIQWGRKPMTSCNTPVSPGMYVKTQHSSSVIKKAQEGVLEYMLSNHPLDCPICDQAGECPLQIMTFLYGPEGSRYEVQKVHKPKRIQLGPNVILDAERCINCTRCVRFTREISKSNQLSMIARGEKNFPATFPGETFDDPYSMNVVDLCPVGALTSADFRFKARVWEMSSTQSVCTECSKGCSIDVWVKDNQVLRITPRHNPEVNDFWMCDEGRLQYDKYNKNRTVSAYALGTPVPLDKASTALAETLKNASDVLYIGSPYSGFENNYALKIIAEKIHKTTPYFVRNIRKGKGDNFLRRDDRTPNAKACEILGLQETSPEELKQLASNAGLIVILEDERLASMLAEDFGEKIVAFAWHKFENYEKVGLVIPSTMEIEANTLFINEDGIAQITYQAKQIKRMTPEMWMFMNKARPDSSGVAADRWRHPEHIIDALPAWSILAGVSKQNHWNAFDFTEYRSLLTHLKQKFPVLEKVSLHKKPPRETFKRDQYHFAIK